MVADARRRWPLWTILGGAVSAQILMIAALVMIYLALDLDPLVLEAGQILGGLYLIWLGCDGLCGGGGETTTPRRSRRTTLAGHGGGPVNPKDILFFLAFLPGFILPAQPFAPQATVLIVIWLVIDLSILLAYSLLSRRTAGEGLVQRLLDILPNYFLIGLGRCPAPWGCPACCSNPAPARAISNF